MTLKTHLPNFIVDHLFFLIDLKVYKTINICEGDVKWLEIGNQAKSYELKCIYNNITSILITESSLYFTYKIGRLNWINLGFNKIDCLFEIDKWHSLKLNFTYTVQNECNNNLNRISINRGALCTLKKSFLKNHFFKTSRFVLETKNYIYPYPYGLKIKYICI